MKNPYLILLVLLALVSLTYLADQPVASGSFLSVLAIIGLLVLAAREVWRLCTSQSVSVANGETLLFTQEFLMVRSRRTVSNLFTVALVDDDHGNIRFQLKLGLYDSTKSFSREDFIDWVTKECAKLEAKLEAKKLTVPETNGIVKEHFHQFEEYGVRIFFSSLPETYTAVRP